MSGLIYFLSQAFSGRLILPQSFHLGSITIHYYGLIMALAVASGWKLAKKRAVEYGIDPHRADDLIFRLIIGGFIGARLYHVFSSFDYYRHHLIDIVKVWHGGLSIYGALFGGLIVVLVGAGIARPKPGGRWPPLQVLDWLAPSLILGQIIGRFGNFFNYEAFGYPTNLPWKMFVPFGFRPAGYRNMEFFHPWFLYEQIGNLIILILLLAASRRRSSGVTPEDRLLRNSGKLFFWYLLLYNILRLGLEFLRVDSPFIGSFRLNSLTSLILAVFGAGVIAYQNYHSYRSRMSLIRRLFDGH